MCKVKLWHPWSDRDTNKKEYTLVSELEHWWSEKFSNAEFCWVLVGFQGSFFLGFYLIYPDHVSIAIFMLTGRGSYVG